MKKNEKDKKEKNEEELMNTDVKKNKKIIEKESYMLYFTLTYIIVRFLFNGINYIPYLAGFSELSLCVLTNFLMILATICAMTLNFSIHKKHRVNKHQFRYIKKFMFTMFCIVTLLVNILFIIEQMKNNVLATILLLIIHFGIIYLYNIILFDKYVEKTK